MQKSLLALLISGLSFFGALLLIADQQIRFDYLFSKKDAKESFMKGKPHHEPLILALLIVSLVSVLIGLVESEK
jgi:hypothetical protein